MFALLFGVSNISDRMIFFRLLHTPGGRYRVLEESGHFRQMYIARCLQWPSRGHHHHMHYNQKVFVTFWSYSSYDHYMTSVNWS